MNFTRQSLSFKKNKPNSLPSPQPSPPETWMVSSYRTPHSMHPKPSLFLTPCPDQHEPLLCVLDLYFRGVSIYLVAYALAACLFFSEFSNSISGMVGLQKNSQLFCAVQKFMPRTAINCVKRKAQCVILCQHMKHGQCGV